MEDLASVVLEKIEQKNVLVGYRIAVRHLASGELCLVAAASSASGEYLVKAAPVVVNCPHPSEDGFCYLGCPSVIELLSLLHAALSPFAGTELRLLGPGASLPEGKCIWLPAANTQDAKLRERILLDAIAMLTMYKLGSSEVARLN